MTFRPYDPARDLEAVRRIWREAGRATVDLTEGAVADIGGTAIKNRSGTTIAVSGVEDLAFRIIRK